MHRMGGLVAIGIFVGSVAGCVAPGASIAPGVSIAPGATTLTPGCFLTPAEVEAATGHTLSMPPEGRFDPKGDQSCLYYLNGVAIVSVGCHCLGTNGPFDLQGQGTAWLNNLGPDGRMVTGIGDAAYFLDGSRGSELWVVKGQTGIHIGIDYQHLSLEQLTVLANAAFGRLAVATPS